MRAGRTRQGRALIWAAATGGLAAVLLATLGGDLAAEQARTPPGQAARSPPPLPPPRPESGPLAPGAAAGVPAPLPAAQSEADPSACLARVEKLGVKLEPQPALSQGGCRAPHPFKLSALPPALTVSPAAVLACPVAEALARWVAEAVVPEAASQLGRAPKSLLIGASFECRGRNRALAAPLSEHGFANAVDIMGFAFESGPVLLVTDRAGDTPEGRFQTAVRQRACAFFTTVLGPGADASHSDHLHLDLKQRRGGFRICQ